MDAFWFFAGVAAYYKLDEVLLAREAKERDRDDAIERLRWRAQSLQEKLEEMERDLIYDPEKYNARQMRAAEQRADRAQEALLLAQAGHG